MWSSCGERRGAAFISEQTPSSRAVPRPSTSIMSRVMPPDSTPPASPSKISVIENPNQVRVVDVEEEEEEEDVHTIMADDSSPAPPQHEHIEHSKPLTLEIEASKASTSDGKSRSFRRQMTGSVLNKLHRTKSRFFGKHSASGDEPPSLVHTCEIVVDSLEPKAIQVTLDTSGQHTLSWSVPVRMRGEPDTASSTLPIGTCNLYLFPSFTPRVTKTDARVDETIPSLAQSKVSPTPPQLAALRAIFVGLAADPSCDLCSQPDSVGAFPIHAITVANTDDSVSLAEAMIDARPRLLLQGHVMLRANNLPLFTGETSLHICCVNRREATLCRFIDLIMERLTREEARTLLLCQASGVFFQVMPMRNFGGTPLTYACCFELRNAVRKMLETGLISMSNREESTCVLTGFQPIHAVAANGLRSMYDFITEELPEEHRAAVVPAGVGRLKTTTIGLSPMQLCAKLGDHEMVKHIMRKQTTILWVWGPVTQHSIDLRGIDSAGAGGGDIMELIAHMEAGKRTTELVLDSFMGGFIYSLFIEKWHKYGRKIYYSFMLIDLINLLLLVVLAFALKSAPDDVERLHPLCVVMLCLMALGTAREARTTWLFVKNYAYDSDGDGDVDIVDQLRLAVAFMHMHWVCPRLVLPFSDDLSLPLFDTLPHNLNHVLSYSFFLSTPSLAGAHAARFIRLCHNLMRDHTRCSPRASAKAISGREQLRIVGVGFYSASNPQRRWWHHGAGFWWSRKRHESAGITWWLPGDDVRG